MRIGAPDPTLTPVAGMVAVTELVERLDVIGRLDAAIGPIKQRRRGHTGGQLLVGIAAAQLAGEDFLVGLDRQRADTAGQQLAPVPDLAATTAAGLARRLSAAQWAAVETGLGDVHAAALAALAVLAPAAGGGAVRERDDRSGHHRRGGLRPPQARGGVQPPRPAGRAPARRHLGRHRDGAGRGPAGRQRGSPPRRRLRCCAGRWPRCPTAARAGRIRLRADAGYFAGQLARAALFADIEFAIGARRIAPLWRLLDGIAEADWTDAIDMPGAQVAVADYCPNWWPAATRLLIRRVRLDVDRRSRCRPIRGPGGAAPCTPTSAPCPCAELAELDAVYGYSFIVTNLDVVHRRARPPRSSTGTGTAPRSRTCSATPNTAPRCATCPPDIPRSTGRGCGARCSPPASPAGCTSSPPPPHADGGLLGHGVRDGQAMIATLRHRLIRVPARLVRHAGALILRLPPGYDLLAEVLARIRALPATS